MLTKIGTLFTLFVEIAWNLIRRHIEYRGKITKEEKTTVIIKGGEDFLLIEACIEYHEFCHLGLWNEMQLVEFSNHNCPTRSITIHVICKPGYCISCLKHLMFRSLFTSYALDF